MYVDKEMSMKEISEELDIALGTVHNWLYEYGILKPKWIDW